MTAEEIYSKAFQIKPKTVVVRDRRSHIARADTYATGRVWQSMSPYKRKGTYYRRDAIHDYYKTTLHLTDDTDCLLLSYPSIDDINKALELRKNGRFIRIVYDRSDYWDDRNADDYCIKNADIVINSSRYLYEHCKDADAKVYIPNRCRSYPIVNKERKDIAVYCGYDTKKVDKDFIDDFLEANPDIAFECYTHKPISGLEQYWKGFIPEDQLFDHLLECKWGLLPLNDSRWSKGMLPLKYFLYRNAGLEVVRTKTACYNTDEFDDLSDFDWKDVLEDFRPYIDIEEWSSPYRSHLRWFTGHKCNYNCPYCCQSGEHNDGIRDLTKDIELINRLRPERIQMIGGEPTIYDLPTILKQIDWSFIKSFKIFTNLSKDAQYYIDLYNISHSIRLSASLHLDMCDPNKFLDKVRAIQKSGMLVMVTGCVDDSNIDKYKQLDFSGIDFGARAIRDNNRPRKMSDETKQWILDHQSSLCVAAFNTKNNGYVGYGLVCVGKPCVDNGTLYTSGCVKCRRAIDDLSDTSIVCSCKCNCSLCMSQETHK